VGGRDGGREGGKEGRREGGTEGGRDGMRERRREGECVCKRVVRMYAYECADITDIHVYIKNVCMSIITRP
jgi:hypothetical protein